MKNIFGLNKAELLLITLVLAAISMVTGGLCVDVGLRVTAIMTWALGLCLGAIAMLLYLEPPTNE